MNRNVKSIYPEYLSKFKCIGGKCEDTCCKDWTIYIDKNTFGQYKNIEDIDLNKYINNNIIRHNTCKNENSDYGHIKLNDSNICPFLDKDNYCMIQKKLGESYLGNVCTNFPRIINKIDHTYEISLDVSCLEAAKIILLNKEKMKFIQGNTILKNDMINDTIDTKNRNMEYSNERYVKQLRNVSIEIMQNRTLRIDERLAMLGHFLHGAIRELTYNYFQIYDYIESYNTDSLISTIDKSFMDYMMQISFFRKLVRMLYDEKFNISINLKNIINTAIEGFQFNNGQSMIDKQDKYVYAYTEFHKNILSKYSYIFENYIVNHIFKELFPFSNSDVVFDDYIMLVIRYSFVKFILIGNTLAHKNEKITEEDIIKVIQVFSKEIEHNEQYLSDVRKYLKRDELYTERFAGILL